MNSLVRSKIYLDLLKPKFVVIDLTLLRLFPSNIKILTEKHCKEN